MIAIWISRSPEANNSASHRASSKIQPLCNICINSNIINKCKQVDDKEEPNQDNNNRDYLTTSSPSPMVPIHPQASTYPVPHHLLPPSNHNRRLKAPPLTDIRFHLPASHQT